MSATQPYARERRAPYDRVLFERIAGDGDARARDELVDRFLPLAHALALRYQRSYEPFDDLVQAASVGLLEAIDRFDPARGVAFSSVALPMMLGEIRRHFRTRGWAGLEALQAGASYRGLSCDVLVPAAALSAEDDGFERAEDRATIQALLELVPHREREILRLRFEEDRTQAQIGAVIGLSQMQVSRLIRSILERLRALAESPGVGVAWSSLH
jgi:RNA polymerase sigma-B factor